METNDEKIKRISEILEVEIIKIVPNIIFSDKELPGLNEARDYFSKIPGLKGYSYRKDKPNGMPGPGNHYHWHIYLRGKECFVVNIDGTGHDGYHNVKIDDVLADFLRQQGADISSNNIIECRDYSHKQLLCD